MAVAGNLFRIATSEGAGAVTAAIFWLKTRAGWREPTGRAGMYVASLAIPIETKVGTGDFMFAHHVVR